MRSAECRLAVVALGSNLGDTREILSSAMERLRALTVGPMLRSSLYRSAPVECPPGSPDFLNAVVGFEPRPGETPESLLDALQALEREFGRRPKRMHNEARPLDLDLIVFGGERRDTARLVLPHPQAHLRAFVLKPLAEIAPDLVLPGQRVTVAELVAQLPGGDQVERIAAG